MPGGAGAKAERTGGRCSRRELQSGVGDGRRSGPVGGVVGVERSEAAIEGLAGGVVGMKQWDGEAPVR